MATCISGKEGDKRNAYEREALYVLSVPHLLPVPITRTFNSPGKVLKINTSPLSLDTTQTLDDGENLLRTAVVSGDYGYFG